MRGVGQGSACGRSWMHASNAAWGVPGASRALPCVGKAHGCQRLEGARPFAMASDAGAGGFRRCCRCDPLPLQTRFCRLSPEGSPRIVHGRRFAPPGPSGMPLASPGPGSRWAMGGLPLPHETCLRSAALPPTALRGGCLARRAGEYCREIPPRRGGHACACAGFDLRGAASPLTGAQATAAGSASARPPCAVLAVARGGLHPATFPR